MNRDSSRLNTISRKTLLTALGAAVLARCGPQVSTFTVDGGSEPDSGAPDAGEHDAGELDAGQLDAGQPDSGVTPQCPETAYDSIGPCHRPNAPIRTALSQAGDGLPLFITGRVAGKSCGVIASAEIDIWHANAQGTYSDLGICGGTDGATFRWRGRQFSRTDGGWGFDSIYPGSFQNRPVHIHMQVRAPGYQSLVTQLYFEDDPFLLNEGPKPSSLVVLPRRVGDARHAVFDIVLAPA